jgi:hypothetical protein
MWMGRFCKLVLTETEPQAACCDSIDRKVRRLDVDGQVCKLVLTETEQEACCDSIDRKVRRLL